MAILPKLINRFNPIPIKIPSDLQVKKEKLVLKYIWKSKETRIAKTIFGSGDRGAKLEKSQ